MHKSREKHHAFHEAYRLEEVLKGVPFQCPGLTVVGIILLDEPVTPHLNGLDELYTKHRGRRDNDRYFRILVSSDGYLHVHGVTRQQPGKVVWRMVDTPRACVHYNHLVAATLIRIVPCTRPRRPWHSPPPP